MNKESKEWRALEAYVNKRRDELRELLTVKQSEEASQEKRVEYRLLGELLRNLEKPEREIQPTRDFGLK